MSRDIIFHINNMAYTIEDIDESLEQDLKRHLNIHHNISTKELLLAYLRITQEFNTFKQDVEKITDKIPQV